MLLDGVPVTPIWTPIGTSGFSAAEMQFAGSPGNHLFTAPRPFGVFTYGMASVSTYSYPGGMAVAAIATVDSISVTVGGSIQQVGTEICGITATVLDSSSNPAVGVRVDLSTSLTLYQASGFTGREWTGELLLHGRGGRTRDRDGHGGIHFRHQHR